MRPNLRTLPQSKIFKQSLEQFGRELSQFFPDKNFVPAYMTKMSDDISDIEKMRDKKDFAIPFFTYRVDNMAANRERFNRSNLRRQGLMVDKRITSVDGHRPDDPHKIYHNLHLTPTDVTLDVIYYCAYTDMYDFGPMWQQAAQEHYLNFELDIGEIGRLPIKCELSDDITFSEAAIGDSQYIQFVTSVVMSTYHGVMSNVMPITSYKATTGIVKNSNEDEAEYAPSLEVTREKDMTVFVNHKQEREYE